MVKTISVNIDEQVRNHFQKFIEDHGHEITAEDLGEAREKITHARSQDNDSFIVEQLNTMEIMLKMLGDSKWIISEEESRLIQSAVKYFIDDDDVIPDDIPGIGYLDDCIVVDNTAAEIEDMLDDYMHFCRSRVVYTGGDPDFSMEDWETIKKQEAGSRLRKRRSRRSRGGGSKRTRIF